MTVGEPVDRDVAALLASRAREACARSRRVVRRSHTLVSARRVVCDEEAMVTSCAWCGRLSLGEAWARPAEAGLWSGFLQGRTTHGICPDCLVGLAANGESAPFAA